MIISFFSVEFQLLSIIPVLKVILFFLENIMFLSILMIAPNMLSRNFKSTCFFSVCQITSETRYNLKFILRNSLLPFLPTLIILLTL